MFKKEKLYENIIVAPSSSTKIKRKYPRRLRKNFESDIILRVEKKSEIDFKEGKDYRSHAS